MEKRLSLRESRILKKIRSGKVANSMKLNFSSDKAYELAAMFGFDAVWTDMEHIGCGYPAINSHIMAAKIYDTDSIVRTTRHGYSDLIRPLELDATAIMVPHIMSYEDAKNVLDMTRFYPQGRRPIDGGNTDARYANLSMEEYFEYTRKNKFIILQIEDPEPMGDLEKIAKIEGEFMLLFGPGDYAQRVGEGGKPGKKVAEARKLIAKIARDNNKFAGTVASTEEQIKEYIEEGYNFLNIGSDVLALNQYFEKALKMFERITN